MKESKNNTILNQYLREKRMYCYYELKVARGNTFSFSLIEENQHEGLIALAKEGMVWKLSDEDSRKKPCDGFCTPPLPAYLVIKFRDTFYFILYKKIQLMRSSEYKFISQKTAQKLSTYIMRVRA